VADIISIQVTKDVHTELMKIIGQIQARIGKPTTIDDALKELVENYKKKARS